MAIRLLVNGAARTRQTRPLAHVVGKIGDGPLELFLAVVLFLISLALCLVCEGKCRGHGLHGHHLNQDLFGILKPLEQ